MAKIIDNTGTEASEAKTIMVYFGRKPDQGVAELHAELKALTPESKTELACGAAKELGWTVVAS